MTNYSYNEQQNSIKNKCMELFGTGQLSSSVLGQIATHNFDVNFITVECVERNWITKEMAERIVSK